MKLKIVLLSALALILSGAPAMAAAALDALPEKHPLDESESRTLILENGLEVILVSDPELNISSASMAIDAGSLMDPAEDQGLAHFLEHMLFLGTEKYPDEGEYTEYLTQNGGYSNAYTAGDHTNYHFEVFPDAYEGALDRFAQFFIAPLFTEEFTERELNAIESEFAKNLESDAWRGFRMFSIHAREDHPEHSFNIGNKQSLANATREDFISFYEKYYSANQMALSLVSTHSLDEMEAWVREYFSPIRSQGREPLRYPADYLEDKEAVRMVKMKAIENRRRMNIYFNTPGVRHDWDAKSSQIIGSILGYEGKGSLLSSLKDANLATALGAGFWDETVDYSTLSISIDLTPAGQQDPERVLEMVLGYIELMRQSPYPEYFYEERATMARLKEVYSDKGEGANRAVALANRALQLPLAVAEDAPNKYLRKDPDFYFEILDQLRPENMLVILSAKDLETDRVEDIFGIEYSSIEMKGELFDRLSSPPVADSFSLPKPNPFIPESVELLAERPVRLIDEPALSLYYAQDQEFQRPKVAIQFKIRLPERDFTAREAVLLEFYEAAVNEYINEIAYDALMADLGYSVRAGLGGVVVSLFGYTESAKELLPVLVDALQDFEIEEERFAAIHERMVREWNNARYDNAFMYIRYFTNKASYEDYFFPHEKAEAAAEIGIEDVYALSETLYESGKIEALVYGNMTATASIEAARNLQSRLGLVAPDMQLHEPKLVNLVPGTGHTFKDVLPTNNSVFRKDYTLGLATPERRVAAAVLQNLIQAPYYSEMRTRQQLGYVVWSFTFEREDEVKLGFVIQSGEYDPLELVDRSDKLVASFPDMLREMPEDAFEKARAAVRSEIETEEKTIAEKAGRFFSLAYDHGANWSRKQDALDALANLTRDDVIDLMESVNNPEAHRYQLVLLFKRQAAEMAEKVDAVTDIEAWKKTQAFREVTEI